MRTETKGRLAVAAMIDLAANGMGGPVALSAIAQRLGVSLSYLEQLFGRLRRAGLVHSVRGVGGGYVLAHPPRAVTAADIVVAVDEPAQDDRRDDERPDAGVVDTRALWHDANARMMELLGAVTLESLVAAHVAKASSRAASRGSNGIWPRPADRRPMSNAANSIFSLAAELARSQGAG